MENKTLKDNRTGWVVVNLNYNSILIYTFSSLRENAIKKFCDDPVRWQKLRRKQNYQCVRADQTIKIEL